ncbi:uncharacterized protein LOC134837533 [Culicoides brevitarsis]|uniref:uncharacterized protein LOC134837533 n=1 Tax=Culicoides brevitarsis TaxID=469753 RepID=UPI00307C8283
MKSNKPFEIIYETEKVADKIITNKRHITELSQKKEDTREAIRELQKSTQTKAWTSVSGMLVKTTKEIALELLKKDQKTLEDEINKLRDENKLLVKKHRDLEQNSPLTGFDLKPLSSKEIAGLRSNLPYF